jgi:predicted DNA-binding ribbon-helix-helix protein
MGVSRHRRPSSLRAAALTGDSVRASGRRDRPGPGPDGGAGATIGKRSVVIRGHKTSVSLEDAFWRALKTIAAERGVSLAQLIAEVDAARGGNLSSALRVFVLERTGRRGSAG